MVGGVDFELIGLCLKSMSPGRRLLGRGNGERGRRLEQSGLGAYCIVQNKAYLAYGPRKDVKASSLQKLEIWLIQPHGTQPNLLLL